MITCPLSGVIMTDPVCVNGTDYERAAIMDFLFKNDYDPKGMEVDRVRESSDLVK